METPEQIPLIIQPSIKPIFSPVASTQVFHPITPKVKWGKFVFLFLFILIVGTVGFFAYKYKYELFESSWRHSINGIEEKYTIDAATLESNFNEINNVKFLQTASSSPTANAQYIEKVNTSITLLNIVRSDIDNALQNINTNPASLSESDVVAQSLLKTCYEERKNGATVGLEALQNTSKYVQAYTLLQNYYTYDLKKFRESFLSLSASMQAHNVEEMKTKIVTARNDLLVAKADIDNTSNLLGSNSYKQISAGFQLFLDGINDIEASIPGKNVSLVNKATDEWQKGGNLFETYKLQMNTDLLAWLDTNVTAKYTKQNEIVTNANVVCAQALVASGFAKEHTPANEFIKMVKEKLYLSTLY